MANILEYLDYVGLLRVVSHIKELLSVKADKSQLPSQVSQLANDAGYLAQSDLAFATDEDIHSIFITPTDYAEPNE